MHVHAHVHVHVYGLIEAYIFIYNYNEKRKTGNGKLEYDPVYCEEAGYGTCGLYEIVCMRYKIPPRRACSSLQYFIQYFIV